MHAGAALVLAAFTAHAGPVSPLAYGPDQRAILSAVEARAIALARARMHRSAATLRASGSLVRAARELAARAAEGDPDPISPARVRGALARALAYDAAPAAILVAGSPEDVAEAAVRSLPHRPATHLGAGAVERAGKEWIVLLLSKRTVRLDPFPRDLPPGARAVLSGLLSPRLAGARVFLRRPSGRVTEAGGAAGRAFRFPLEFPSRGRHVVEVIAEGNGGPEVAALLAVSVGGASLDPPPAPPSRADPPDRADAEATVVEAVNATRRRNGLPPLAPAADIAAVARRHSEAMAAARRVAHRVPGSGDLSKRLVRAGVSHRRAFENVARGPTALEAQANTEESPAHLANILSPEASRIGVGIARVRLPQGSAEVYLTEVFVEPQDDGSESPLTPDARVREALWRERARLGLPPLTSDPALDALARDSADAMHARDETEADDLGDRALALHRKIAAVDVFVASGPEETVRSGNLRDARFSRVGVGVVRGDSARFGKGRLWIAVVYTD